MSGMLSTFLKMGTSLQQATQLFVLRRAILLCPFSGAAAFIKQMVWRRASEEQRFFGRKKLEPTIWEFGATGTPQDFGARFVVAALSWTL
jgi:hypothetical protein